MKAYSQYFKDNIRGLREIATVISYKDKSDGLYIMTQNSENILTEGNFNLITQYKSVIYDNNSINRVNITYNSDLFSTICKTIEIETVNKIEKGTIINVQIGCYIDELEDYEFIDLGNYTTLTEPTFQVDTKSYSVIAYDKMYESMVNYDDDPLEVEYPITHKNLLIAICNKFGWYHSLNNYPNYDKLITSDLYNGQQLTYRDVLDDLNKGCYGCLMFQNNRLILRVPSESGYIIEDQDLKDTNININEKYGKVNSLYVTENGVVLDYKLDSQSIEQNGETKFEIKDSLLLDSQHEDFINNLFNAVDGLEYHLFDVESTGIVVLDPLDIVTIRHDGVDYKTIIFNDDIIIQSGLSESLFNNKPESGVSEYYSEDKAMQKLRDASIKIDKAAGQIVLKANSNGKIVQAELKADADDGSIFNVSADNISLSANDIINIIAGNTINLSSKNISIDSNNFKVTTNGDLTASNVNISGNINATSGNFSGTINAGGGVISSFTIDGNAIYNAGIGTPNSCGISGTMQDWAVWAGNGAFRVTQSGELNASNANIVGNINSSTINGSVISGGSISITKGNYYFNMGLSTSNPNCSGLNVGNYGIKANSGITATNFAITNGDTGKGVSVQVPRQGGGWYYLTFTGGILTAWERN